jgi:hypothetical protein
MPDDALLSNNPPDDIAILRDNLDLETEALRGRTADLVAAVDRAPPTIDDDEVCAKVADLVKLISACAKVAEDKRVSRKEPFLASGRAVDGYFKTKILDPLDKGKATLSARLTTFQRRKAEDERQRREAEARRQRDEAARAAKDAAEKAAAMQTDAGLDDALAAEELAQQAEADAEAARRAAAAKPAELSRTRGDLGAVASLRTFWSFRDLDRATLDLDALREHLPVDALEKAVRSYVKAGGRTLRGVTIFEDAKTAVA